MKSVPVTPNESILSSQYNDLRGDAYGGSILLAHQQSSPGLTLEVEAGVFWIQGTRYIYAGGNSPTITAPISNPRIDLLTINTSGTLALVGGSENVSPVAPTYPAGVIVICEIYNVVGETMIFDFANQTAGQGYIYNDVRPFLQNINTKSANGVSTRSTSGAQTIAHGLGRIPTIIRLTAKASSDRCFGLLNSNQTSYIDDYFGSGSGGGTILNMSPDAGTSSISCTILVDATNITLTWTVVGTATANFLWEAN